MDSILSFTTLIAAIINFIWNLSLEGYLGVIIAGVIIKSAIELLKETVGIMLGERADKDLTDKIKNAISSYEEVQGVYDFNLHNYGPSKSIATVHIQVRNNMTAEELHILTRKIAGDIFNEFGILITIGIYAANSEGKFGIIKNEIQNIIKEYNYVKQMHGFFIDEKNKSIYFDLIIDFDCEDPLKIKEEIKKNISAKYPEYSFDIILDADISD